MVLSVPNLDEKIDQLIITCRGIVEKISESTRDRGRLFRFVRCKGQGVQQDNDRRGPVRSPAGGCVESPTPR